MTIIGAPVAVWTAETGRPQRLFWGGRRYRVTDTPTLVDADFGFITHPPDLPPVWRFQGTTDDGQSLVFDVRFDHARGEWVLLRTWE
ncbi:MAG: hypothetical protein H7146_12270 [Burkholderiaceae bacterium]|nr:hypothetical protein [Microbacteriaceae bacterium]